jgi:YD repeat-containing protein
MNRPTGRGTPRVKQWLAAGLGAALALAALSRTRWLHFGVLLGDPPRAPSVVPCHQSRVSEPDAFPWSGVVTLTDAQGQVLTWVLCRVDGEVRITGTRPGWEVEHRAKSDGTPLFTVHQRDGVTTRITYSPDGAQVERTNVKGERSTVTIQEKGLWDGDTLDARLAGIAWRDGQKVRLKIIDADLGDGTTYPMVAEYAEARCNGVLCKHVHLALDDFRRAFAPSFEYRFGLGVGAKYLQYDGDGLTFSAR